MTTQIIIDVSSDAQHDVQLTRKGLVDPNDKSVMRFVAGQRYDFYLSEADAVEIKEVPKEVIAGSTYGQ